LDYYYLEEEKNCTYACHNGSVTDLNKDIQGQFGKIYSHPVQLKTIGDFSGNFHDPTEDVTNITGHVECQDCHDPHSINGLTATAPDVSGMISNVVGIDANGNVSAPALYEYEICFKCHGDSNTDNSIITRYLDQTNTRLDFATTNPSFHPVVGMGKNSDVPSLPSSISLDPTLSESSLIYCSDCHSSDGTSKVGGPGPNGPHGSIYQAILRERYDFTSGVSESYALYALCYRCHERSSILNNLSFRARQASGLGGHAGHLTVGGGTSCSVCHDPHGVVDDNVSGSHTHLINFDSTVVSSAPGQTVPLYTDNGNFTGSCTLVCHGVTHDGSATYTYP